MALVAALKENHTAVVRPVKRPNDTVIVALSIALANIYDVDEKNKMLKIKGWIHQVDKYHQVGYLSTYFSNECLMFGKPYD